MTPTGKAVAEQAISTVHTGYTYDEMDCQAFVEHAVAQAGGRMDYRGSNDMARSVSRLWTLNAAQAQGKIVPGALLFIREENESNLPARYRGDGMGDFSHVGVYLGPDAMTDKDRNGRVRSCDVAHSSASMGRAAGSTLQNGWTHIGWAKEIDYGENVQPEEKPQETASETVSAQYAVVTSENGKPVKMRKSASGKEPVYWHVSVGERVRVERKKGKWTLIRAICTDGYARRGYMMTEFMRME